MPGAFLYADLVRGGVLSAPAASVPSMPLSNLLDPQPRVRTRFVGAAAAVLVDLLAVRALDCVALIGTTLTASATVRARLSTTDATGAAGDAWDSGVVPADTTADANGNVVLLRGAGPASGRYLRVDIADAALSVIDVGRLVAGALWRLARPFEYGCEEGRLILDRRDRNDFTGAEFPVPAVANPRFARFSVAVLSDAEIIGQHRALLARLGAAGDGLWIPEITLSQAELNARSLWGGLNQPGATTATNRFFNGNSRSFTMNERV